MSIWYQMPSRNVFWLVCEVTRTWQRCPCWVAQLVAASSHTPKGWGFDPQSGHIMEATQRFSLSPKSINISSWEDFKNLYKWECITSKVRSKRHCGFCLPLSWVEETSCHAMLWGQPGSPQDRPTGRGTEAFCHHPCEWVRPGSQYFSPFILQRHEALGDSWTSTCWDPDVQSSSQAASRFLTHSGIHTCLFS